MRAERVVAVSSGWAQTTRPHPVAGTGAVAIRVAPISSDV
ncbi:hypothetical protein I547_6377 [Mycobacterium kansasii 824]|nr:hypothetical protein I547_6377 [Mycobacterium kansasii 824]